MIISYQDLLPSQILNKLLNDSIVLRTKQQLDKSHTKDQYFFLDVDPEIQEILINTLGVNCSTRIPFRWIRGDIQPHVDHGERSFHHTYLVFLTQSQGELIIEDEQFFITQNTAYVFPSNCKHGTINTNDELRLLLGPMSEEGFPVDSDISNKK